ncbi:MAG: aspartate/glutamate racemase family protein, partial [Candidatus Andersenbacteria bacterium]|nr:aspartate/glutamate racemase family protein [Candidatus Andersenbacteria bacterium]
MIGVFDSGFGGLTILRVLVDRLPRYSYVYLGDNARMPFGSRTADDVFALTWHGVDYLFRRGCALVILACNTASAVCLRRIQQEELPAQYPDRRVLGIVVPTIEQITGVNWEVRKAVPVGQTDVRSVGVLATTQTVRSQAYPHEIRKRRPSIRVVQQACPRLAALIEAGAQQTKLRREIKKCLAALYQAAGNDIDAILLGCTH